MEPPVTFKRFDWKYYRGQYSDLAEQIKSLSSKAQHIFLYNHFITSGYREHRRYRILDDLSVSSTATQVPSNPEKLKPKSKHPIINFEQLNAILSDKK
jgi:hypothetical protein